MYKKISVLSFILFYSFISVALAHTGIQSSSPENGEVVTEPLEQITLTFETKIEQGSTFTVEDVNGQNVTVENITVNNNQLIGEIPNSLESSTYTVNWSIIGADGHLIEESFNFTVDIPTDETTVENAETEVEEPTTVEEETGVEEQNKTITETQTETNNNEPNTANQTNELESEQEEASSNLTPILIGVLIVVVIVGFLFLNRRKK
nr:copper resistance CopC family protein [Lysinibacillus timonensis]